MTDTHHHERIDAIFREVGRITLIWAQLDTMLDFCNVTIKGQYGDHPKVELPRTRLNDKIRFMRECLEQIPNLAPSRDQGVSLAKEIKALADERHWIVHGAADTLSSQETIRLARTHLKGSPSIEERHITLTDLSTFGDVSLSLTVRLTEFLLFRLQGLSEDELNQVRRELGIHEV